MNNQLKDAILKRRSYYALSNQSPISDESIIELVELALKNVPSPFNCQSARTVVLLGENHLKLWKIAKETLKKMVPADRFPATESKINNSFQSGYGTILFFEDENVIDGLCKQMPDYADNFKQWSLVSSGMMQYTVWVLLENEGFGASLQHYNPLIDEEVKAAWGIESSWRLMAEMPFGIPTAQPGEKTFEPIEKRMKVFK